MSSIAIFNCDSESGDASKTSSESNFMKGTDATGCGEGNNSPGLFPDTAKSNEIDAPANTTLPTPLVNGKITGLSFYSKRH